MNYIVKRKRRNDFGVKGMKKGVRKAVSQISDSAVGNAAKTIGKNYKKAFHNNVGLAERMLKQKNIGHKLTGAYLAATTPLATALGGTVLNIKSGYKGAKKMITGKDSAIREKYAYKDYGVKGMKKGEHLKAQEPQSNGPRPSGSPSPDPAVMKRLKKAGVAVGKKNVEC